MAFYFTGTGDTLAGCQACMACIHACPNLAMKLEPPVQERNPKARCRNAHASLAEPIAANGRLLFPRLSDIRKRKRYGYYSPRLRKTMFGHIACGNPPAAGNTIPSRPPGAWNPYPSRRQHLSPCQHPDRCQRLSLRQRLRLPQAGSWRLIPLLPETPRLWLKPAESMEAGLYEPVPDPACAFSDGTVFK